MRMLLTGASGFIGRNIAEQLADRHDILAPSHHALDLTDQAAVDAFFEANAVDVVVHAAIKPGHRNAQDHTNLLDNDLRMYFNLVRNTEPRGIRLFHLGSGSCYDLRHYTPLMREEDMGRHIPADDTGFAKYVIGTHALTSAHVYDLRVFGIFGKYEDYAIRFISNALCKALHGLPITLRQDRLFDYVYIDDFVRLLDAMLDKPLAFHAYNCTAGEPTGLLALANLAREVAQADVPILVGSDGQGLSYTGDPSRLLREFPSFAFTPQRKAVEALCDWYRTHMDTIDRSLLLTDK